MRASVHVDKQGDFLGSGNPANGNSLEFNCQGKWLWERTLTVLQAEGDTQVDTEEHNEWLLITSGLEQGDLTKQQF